MLLGFCYSGPQEPTGDEIDVFLAPLIDELKTDIWSGFPVVDASLKRDDPRRQFNLRGMILWTITDYPGQSQASGHKNMGYCPCAHCGDGIIGTRSNELNKEVYVEHRKLTELDDPIRRNRTHWPREERGPIPITPTAEEWRARYEDQLSRRVPLRHAHMNRWPIFWELPYWKVNAYCPSPCSQILYYF
jgi:hypothetical protein